MSRVRHVAKRKTGPAAKTKARSGELQRLRRQLAEAEETLAAIRSGDVDAIAVDGPQGRQIFTLQSADQPYRVLAERMSEGAASLTADGTILFCNERLAEMVGESPEKLRGSSISSLFAPEHNVAFRELLTRGLAGEARGEVILQRRNGTQFPILASLRMIAAEKARGVCVLLTDLSAIKQADEAIRSQAALHAAMLATSSDGFWIFDEQARLLEVNDVYCRMSGYSREELLRMRIADIDAVKDADNIAAHIRRVAQSGFDRFETVHRRKDGSTFDVEISVSFWREKRQLLLFARDISERKRGEEANLRFASIVRSSDDGIVAKTLDGIITSWNEGAEKIYGYPAAEAVGRSISLVVPPDRLGELDDMLEKIRHGIEVPHYDTVRLRKDGRRIDVSITLSPIKDQSGNVLGVSTIVRDITRQKKTEQELRAASLYSRSLIEASLDPLVTISREGKITDVNEATENATGIRRDRLIGSDFSEYFTEPEKAREGYRQVFAEGFVRDYPLAIRHSSGQVMEVLYNATVFRNEKGEVEGVFAAARDISEQRRAEKKVKEASRYTRSLIEASLDPLVTISRDGKIKDVNEATEKATGIARQQLIGSDFSEYFAEPEKARQGYERVFAEGFVRDYPLAIRHTSGTVMDVLYNATVFKNEHGEVEGVFAAARDITGRKRAEAKLREAALYARSLIEASLDPLVTISRDGRITDVNEATEKATGVSRQDLIGSEFCSYFTEPKKAHEGYRQVFAEGSVKDYALALRHTSGRVIDVVYNASVFRNEQGEVEGVLAAARDVTERKRAEDEVRRLNEELEQRVHRRTAELQAIFDTAPIGIAMTDDTEGRHIRGNPAIERMLGASPGGELSRGSPQQCAPYRILRDGGERLPEDLPMQRAARGEGVAGDVLEVVRGDGSTVILHASAAPLFDEKQQPRGAVGAFLDITDRKRAEEALRESEQRVRRKLESIVSPEGDLGNLELTDILDIPTIQVLLDNFQAVVGVTLGLVDLRGKVLAVSGWQRICMEFHRAHPESCKNCVESDLLLSAGTPAGEFKIYKCKNNLIDVATPIMIGGQHMGNMYFGQFLFADEPIDYEAFHKQAKQYRFNEQEYMACLRTVPRLSRQVVDTSIAFLAKLATVISQLSYSSIKLARSSTQLGRVNEELAASVKELEAFTYSVSHDLRAPLRHISGFSKILSEEFKSTLPDEAQHHLKRIEEGTRRMGMLVDDLLNLARIGRRDLALQACGVRSIVDEVIQELKADCEGRQIEWKIGALPFVECDAGLAKQVFQNLISNAVKFTRPRSPAVIEIGQQDEQGTPVIYIRDNGVGFSMKYAEKLFGVFQRLHRSEDFEGTGVGLATVQRIIHKHGGRIWAQAELDKGATFYFTLVRSGNAESRTKAVDVGDHTA